ncbi:MAG: hypothetical protein V1742_07205, partial [Pseudomonadota bacterium]
MQFPWGYNFGKNTQLPIWPRTVCNLHPAMIRKRKKSVVEKVHGLEEEREFDWLGDSEFLA